MAKNAVTSLSKELQAKIDSFKNRGSTPSFLSGERERRIMCFSPRPTSIFYKGKQFHIACEVQPDYCYHIGEGFFGNSFLSDNNHQ